MSIKVDRDLEQRRQVLCILGPTGTGKSDLGVEAASRVGGEVISADSMQVYRGMDIGTAKLTFAEMRGVPHHLIDVVDPDDPFSVADWLERTTRVIDGLHERGRLPVVVGGTGLYIRALTEDLQFSGQARDESIRHRWEAFVAEYGVEALYEELQRRDAASAARLHPNDVRRVVRALEVFELGEKPMSQAYDWSLKGGRYDVVQIGLQMGRESLYQRVNHRVDKMIELGLVDEVAALLARGYRQSLTSMQAIGYKEMAAFVTGESTLGEAVEAVKRATRRYVKRQVSWFNRDPRIRWFDKDADGWLTEAATSNILRSAESLAGILVRGKE